MSTTGRPRKACGRCNSQKVRCSGGRPSCQRCLRLNRTCVYSKTTLQDILSFQATPDARQSAAILTESRSSGRLLPSPPITLSERSYVGIPSTLVNALVEVYFSHIYNGHLLLHKRTFNQALLVDTVRPHVLLSVCAFAANFYRDHLDNASLREHGFGYEWAERAGALAFQDVEEPHEENIVTFINLALFWYSQGSWRRSFIHRGNGVQTAHLLGLNHERPGKENSLGSEMSRRRYWACYLINSFASEAPFPNGPSSNVSSLTLPWPDDGFDVGQFKEPAVSLMSRRGNGGIYCELIRAMKLWSLVHLFIKTPESSMTTRITSINDLDAQISEWWSNIPDSFNLSPAMLIQIHPGILPRLLLIHTVYHQCLCALHSSIVPLFSWSEGSDQISYARQVSAQIAFDNANIMSGLFEVYLANFSDCARIPSFIGYAAYCASAIQIPFMWCSKVDVRERACINVKTNLKMIQALGKYWKFIALLAVHVRYLYEMHAKNPTSLDNEPKYLDPDKLKGFRVTANRARTSILSHNDILWSKNGVYANQGEDLTDLGVEDAETTQIAEEASQDLPGLSVVETNSDIETMELYDGMPVEYFQPFLDSEIINSETSFLAFDLNTPQYTDQFDMWLGGSNFAAQMPENLQS